MQGQQKWRQQRAERTRRKLELARSVEVQTLETRAQGQTQRAQQMHFGKQRVGDEQAGERGPEVEPPNVVDDLVDAQALEHARGRRHVVAFVAFVELVADTGTC